MSPEMLLTDTPHTRMVDFYALGCLLYEMMVGVPPFYSNDRQTMYNNIVYQEEVYFPRDFPNDAKDMIEALIVKEPS
jgi:serum/glucocorticoid-regulated kinase 2